MEAVAVGVPVNASPGSAKLRIRRLKAVTFSASLLPLAAIAAMFVLGKLGANPVERAINDTGYWALVFLILSLAATPLKMALGWTFPIQARRMLGLFAFFYASVHLLLYVGVDQSFDVSELVADVVKHKFITLGMLTWSLLLPLAITSTDKSPRRLGFAQWKRLHRLAYVAGVTGCVHFILRGKVVLPEPVLFTLFLLGLLAVRAVSSWKRRRGGSTVS